MAAAGSRVVRVPKAGGTRCRRPAPQDRHRCHLARGPAAERDPAHGGVRRLAAHDA